MSVIRNAANYAAENLQSLGLTGSNQEPARQTPTTGSIEAAAADATSFGSLSGNAGGSHHPAPGSDSQNELRTNSDGSTLSTSTAREGSLRNAEYPRSNDPIITGTGGLNTGPFPTHLGGDNSSTSRYEAPPEARGEPTTSREIEMGIKQAEGVPKPAAQSRNEAHWDPEATGDEEMVHEKTEMEQELLSKVPKEPVAAEGRREGGSGTGIAPSNLGENTRPADESAMGGLGGPVKLDGAERPGVASALSTTKDNTGTVGGGIGSAVAGGGVASFPGLGEGYSVVRDDINRGVSDGGRGVSGIVTGGDGRQTYAPDGYGDSDATHAQLDRSAQATETSIRGDERYGQSASLGNAIHERSTQPTTLDYRGGEDYGRPHGIGGDSGLKSAAQQAANTQPSGASDIGSRSDSRTDAHSNQGYISFANQGRALDNAPIAGTEASATAPGKPYEANRDPSSKPADPATDASFEPRVQSSAASQAQTHQGHESKAKTSNRENPGAIPTAGGERLGERHWGETKMQKE